MVIVLFFFFVTSEICSVLSGERHMPSRRYAAGEGEGGVRVLEGLCTIQVILPVEFVSDCSLDSPP